MRWVSVFGLCLICGACSGAAEPQKRHPEKTVRMLDRISENIAQMPAQRSWRAIPTASFRVFFLTGESEVDARAVARAAEQTRLAQFKLWAPEQEATAWSPRSDIYLYPSNRVMVQMTGGSAKAGSAAARPSRLVRGRMLQRKMNLTADDPHLLDNTLPHEVGHVILAELVGQRRIPLWANEGLAMLNESKRSRAIYRAVVRVHLRRNSLFPLKTLMVMQSYPDDPHKRLYYGQSLSLVRFLLTQGGRSQLLVLLQAGVNEESLREIYGFGAQELQRRWLRWVGAGN